MNLYLAKTTLKNLKEEPYECWKNIKERFGRKEFVPHLIFSKLMKKKAFIVIAGDFVTADEGTGIVTIAAYGEEDLRQCRK